LSAYHLAHSTGQTRSNDCQMNEAHSSGSFSSPFREYNLNVARSRIWLVGLTPLLPGRKSRASILAFKWGIMCVLADYWGLRAKVSDYHFEQMFRITRGYTERIIQAFIFCVSN
jgi:hypothetical protein